MEIFKNWSSLHGYVMFVFLTSLSKGFACEAPFSPQCFRRKADDTVYTCEWSLNTTRSDVTFNLYFDETKFVNIKGTFFEIVEEQLIQFRTVNIWVEAHIGNSICKSPKTSVVLIHAVKYEAAQNILVSWLKSNLSLSWMAAEKYPALAEVWFRRDEHPTEPWEKRLINTTYKDNKDKYQVIVVNLQKNSAYQVKIRQRSTRAKDPLWSDWSQVMVPAELEHEPNVTMTTTSINGTRQVTLTWMPMPLAAAVRNVTLNSSHGCHCMKRTHHTSKTTHTVYVSYSAINISVTAKNDVGESPPAIVQVPAEYASDLKPCNKTLVNKKLKRTTCLELYELQDAGPEPKQVITLTGRMRPEKKNQTRKNLKDYIRYLYFEHRCHRGKPQTVKMCFFYQKEGVPLKEPQEVKTSQETDSSADLSWKAIPPVDQRGFLTYYNLCRVKISQDEQKECYKIPASETKYHLGNLTAGSKYNITLAGVTRVGEGPKASKIIQTKPGKPMNVWLSFSLLFVFFLFSTMCSIVLKKIKVKIFPPVPKPVITDFIQHQPKSQGILEKKEEVHHELTLQQLPEGKSVSEEADDATVVRGEWNDETDEDEEHEGSDSEGRSDECLSPGSTDEAQRSSKEGEVADLEQVDSELAMLIYKNGLVFDMKMDLP